MKALVLAAGLGNRLGEFTTDIPKALVSVAGQRLIDHVLSFIDHPAISEIGIVGGYHFEKLKTHLNLEKTTGKKITLFENSAYTKGSIITLSTALDFLNDSFLLLNIDHIYPKKMLDHILSHSKGLMAICDFNRKLVDDDMKVKLNSHHKIVAIDKKLMEYDCGYIGMTYCDRQQLALYRDAVLNTIRLHGENVSVERVLAQAAADGCEIAICDTSAFRWFEVDTPEDRALAEEALSRGDQ